MNRLRPSSYSRTLALVSPVIALASQQADAGLYLKIETNTSGGTVPGEVTEKVHANWIDTTSMQFGVQNEVTLGTGGITSSKAVPKDLIIGKQLDRASPLLFLACAQGTVYPKVILEFTVLNSATYTESVIYRITLNNVMISKVDNAASGDRPSETVSMSYERITTEYYMMDYKGGVPSTPTTSSVWNFVTNSPK